MFTELLRVNSEAKERMLILSLFNLKGGTMAYYKPVNLPLGSNHYIDNYFEDLDSLSRYYFLGSVLLVFSGTSM